MRDGCFLHDPSTHGPAGEIDLLQVHGIEKSDDQLGLLRDGVFGFLRLFGLAVADEVGGIDAVASANDRQGPC